MTELEKKIQYLSDLEEIRMLKYRYCHYNDGGWETQPLSHQGPSADLFTEDCQLARPFQPEHPYHGREAVQAIFRDRPPILVRHLVTNVLVEVISETEARGTNYLTMLSSHEGTTPPQPSGAIYVGGFEDHYVKTEGQWRFMSRFGRVVLHMGGAMPNIPAPSDEARGLK